MNNKTIVMLVGKSPSSAIVYNFLSQKYNIAAVIQEGPLSSKLAVKARFNFLRRRVRKLGLWTVIGQVLFSVFIDYPLRHLSKKRIDSIIGDNHLSVDAIPAEKTVCVNSINDDEVIRVLQQHNPDVVIVNGTSIIREPILTSVNCRFINTHAGITPKYRGVHGMYWALVNDDIANSGVTVHFVDKGIDTGGVIYQARTRPQRDDNFSTYFYLQIAEGVRILDKAINGYLHNCLIYDISPRESHLYSHPTIWQYLYNRIEKGVK